MHIRDIEVWISTKTETDPAKYRNVLALMDPAELENTQNTPAARRPGTRLTNPGQVEEGK